MRDKYFNINEQGLSVRCKLYCQKDARAFSHVALATYGFGGNKDNHAVQKFAERLTAKYPGYAVLTFDWPGHGNDGRKRLSATESMAYLTLAIDHARRELGAEHLYLYSTSYGGYIALRYIIEVGDPFEAIALRCPAIDMYHVMLGNFDQAELDAMARGKKVLKGYDRKVELDQAFLDDLREHDVRQYEYFDHADRILLLHGTRDEVVPIEDTRKFADDNVIELIEVEHADHPFSNPDTMDFAIGEVVKFLAPNKPR
jgi:alpha-beta hydrolase superfamily lysophospholipase